jgi:hypothetical protein
MFAALPWLGSCLEGSRLHLRVFEGVRAKQGTGMDELRSHDKWLGQDERRGLRGSAETRNRREEIG